MYTAVIYSGKLHKVWGRILFRILILIASLSATLHAEGSKDLLAQSGYRLFMNVQVPQQFKVYVESGEFLHVGSSHVGVANGYISVYRPDGTLAKVYNGTNGNEAIIYDHVQENFGPTGGGTSGLPGFQPGVIQAGVNETGIWTVRFEYPTYNLTGFKNKLNTDSWSRANDQPANQRVVLAWDIAVSKGNPAPNGGTIVTGRVYSNEYVSIINGNGLTTDIAFYVLGWDGSLFQVEMDDIDPWGFPFMANNTGLTNDIQEPILRSLLNNQYFRSKDPKTWINGFDYLLDPQVQDSRRIKNSKIFFNIPDPAMPDSAFVADVINKKQYKTWLNPSLINFNDPIGEIKFKAAKDTAFCQGTTILEGTGGFFHYNIKGFGKLDLFLDMNQNGLFNDPVDVHYQKNLENAVDSIYWNGKDGNNKIVNAQFGKTITVHIDIIMQYGDCHVLLNDIENLLGNITLTRLNGPAAPLKGMYYDHSFVGGSVSGGGTPNNPVFSNSVFNYTDNFGNEKMLDIWTSSTLSQSKNIPFTFNIVKQCTPDIKDTDNDGIVDVIDLDDDNDGIPDKREFCGLTNGFGCLPGGSDPGLDNDGDAIPNYIDASDVSLNNPCPDFNSDGICDVLAPIYDKDQDQVPNHLDLDTDQDGLTDLDEARHLQPDINRDAVIDGVPSEFGNNGFYNKIENNDGPNAVANYTPPDKDTDGVPDNEDRDSDNDGIFDVGEGPYFDKDANKDGAIDGPSAGNGLSIILNPSNTGQPILSILDTDQDGHPDYLDHDSDNDAIYDTGEANLPDPDDDGFIGFGVPIINVFGIPIFDSKGVPLIGTSCPTNTDSTGRPDFQDIDADDDGISDIIEGGGKDPDMNGLPGVGTILVDAFGVPILDANNNPIIVKSNAPDTDKDKLMDFQDRDSDEDGISDTYECGAGSLCVDTDGDGIPDWMDTDSDNDGLSDKDECPGGEPCPDIDQNGKEDFQDPLKVKYVDSDQDGISDPDDIDDDNDGITDWDEYCKQKLLPHFSCLPGSQDPSADTDQDKILNYQDANDPAFSNPCKDVNQDGICDQVAGIYDSDSDNIPNFLDLDSDNDGISDLMEAGHTAMDVNMNGIIDGNKLVFGKNGMYILLSTDSISTLAEANYTLGDKDTDGIPNAYDLDSDNDGGYDVDEAPYSALDKTNDGRIDFTSFSEISLHGFINLIDPTTTGTPLQGMINSDSDPYPDQLDLDSDNDGIPDVVENKRLDSDKNGFIGSGTLTVNIQGIVLKDVNGVVAPPSGTLINTDSDSEVDQLDHDSDNDKILDVSEAELPDGDQNGILGIGIVSTDICGRPNKDVNGTNLIGTSTPRDWDNDGTPDFQDIDRDNDGIVDIYECTQPNNCIDTDGDGTPDIDDLDSDGDGLSDANECQGGAPCPDTDNNGTPEFQQYTCTINNSPMISTLPAFTGMCEGDTTTLEATVTMPFTDTLNYTWLGPNQIQQTGNLIQNGKVHILIPGSILYQGAYSVNVVNSKGCKVSSNSSLVEIKSKPQPGLISPLSQTVCPGEDVQFILSSGSGTSYIWKYLDKNQTLINAGETLFPVLEISNVQQNQAGLYHVLINNGGCQSLPSPLVTLDVLTVDPITCKNDTYSVQQGSKLTGDILSNDIFQPSKTMITIQPPNTGGVFDISNDGKFTFTAAENFTGTIQGTYTICDNNCIDICSSGTFTIEVTPKNNPVCIYPNMITPDDDGFNDSWVLPCLDQWTKKQVTIMNRWGDIVFETKNYDNKWKGTYLGNKLPGGTYFYLLDNGNEVVHGFITIIR